MADVVSPATLLTLWERARPLTPTHRSQVMLRPLGLDDAALGELTIGQRDALLMDLRAQVFGTEISGVTNCPECAQRMDITFSLHDIRMPPRDPPGPIDIAQGGYTVRARPPSLDDLIWLEQADADGDLRSALLERCVIDAHNAGTPIDATQIPEEVSTAVAEALGDADPQADLRLALTCAGCSRTWTAPFDIVAFFWRELESWVWRIARDVDAMAARYGWSEQEILGMSPDRRALYLEVAST